MRKKRSFAIVLSLIMLCGMLPVLSGAAAPVEFAPSNPGLAIAKVMNEINGNEEFMVAYPAEASGDWATANLDFTAITYTGEVDGLSVLSGDVSFDSTDGAVFPETAGELKYYDEVNPNVPTWGPMALTRYYAFGFKLNEGGSLTSKAGDAWSGSQALIEFAPDSVKIYGSENENGVGGGSTKVLQNNLVEYQPGTEWNDVLLYKSNISGNKGGYHVYMKKATDSSYTKLAEVEFFAGGGTLKRGVEFAGADVSVGYTASYKGYKSDFYESVDEILGGQTGASYAFDFNEKSNFANSTGRVGFTAEGYTSDRDGLTLVDPADTETRFTYAPFKLYSPLNAVTIWASDTYSSQALYLQAKGNFNLLIPGPNGYGRIDMAVKVGEEVSVKTAKTEFSAHVSIQDEWTEYLIVPNNQTPNTFVANDGYTLYVKGNNTSEGKWYKVKDCAFENPTTSYGSYGLSFYGVTGHIKKIRTLAIMNSASDEEIIPEKMSLYFAEEFTERPNYPNTQIGPAVCQDGYLKLPTTNSSMDYKLSDVEIPVGGYAEFRAQYDGVVHYRLYDGEKAISVSQQSDYGSITGSTGYSANNNTSWRTWRFVRTENGYSIYSKNDGDTGWFVHAVDVGADNATESMIHFNFGVRNGGGTGENKVDYLRIYGPYVGEMVLTDGNTGKVISENEELMHPDEVYARIVANPHVDRKLILAKYGANDILFDFEVLDIPAGSEDVQEILDLSDREEKVARYKVYLWDSLSGIRPMAVSGSAKGNIRVWTDNWNVSGNAEKSGSEMILKSENGSASFAELNENPGEQFDASWKMEIDNFAGEKVVRFATGTCMIDFSLEEDAVIYRTNSGEKSVPWNLDTKEHLYRLIGNGKTATLWIDGFFVAKMDDLPESPENTGIIFGNVGEGESKANLFIRSYQKSAFSTTNIPQEGFYDDFDTVNGWYLPVSDGTAFTVKDGLLQVEDYALLTSKPYVSKNIPHADDYIFSMRIKFESFGDTAWFVAYLPHKTFIMEFKQMFFAVRTPEGQGTYTGYSDGMKLDTTKWYDLRVETYHKADYVRIYLDDVKVYEGKLPDKTGTSSVVAQFLANGGWIDPYAIKIDYFHCATRDYELAITGLTNDTVIGEGEDISVATSTMVPMNQKVEYMVNETKLATGSGDDNQATISGLKAGTYEIEAVSGNLSSCPVRFEVKKEINAELSVSNSGNKVSASLINRVGFEEVASVSYLLDGKEIGNADSGNFEVSVSEIASGNHMLEAVCYDAGGIVQKRISREISVTGTVPESFANEVSYFTKGNGMVRFANGNHLLQITHHEGKATYLTDSGEENYDYGTGEFCVITEGPVADVYRNGQFVFSYFMPMVEEVALECTGDIENEIVVPTPERKTYFSAKDTGVLKKVYDLAELPSRYVVDFVAGSGVNLHLAINDGYYRNDISIENGVLSVWNGQRNNSFVSKTKATSIGSEAVYYRLETFDGMSRLYANGRFVTAFRGGITVGDDTLAVEVKAGSLEYIAVCDYVDLYMHRDDFSGSGELDSVGYWMSNNLNASVDETKQALKIESNGLGYTTLSADCGNVELSADVLVENANGFWIVNNLGFDTTYNKAGYNFQTGEFEIVDVVDGVVKNKVSESGILPKGETVSVKVSVRENAEGEKVTLYVNGAEVLSQNTEFFCRGRVGFMVDSGDVLVDKVDFRGDSKLVYGENDHLGKNGITLDALENYETGQVYMVNQSGGSVTSDGGKSWDGFVPTPGSGISLEGWGGISQHMVQLKNGSVLSACLQPTGKDQYGQTITAYRIYRSDDYGMNWYRVSSGGPNSPGIEQAGIAEANTVNCLKQGYSGRIYFTKQAGSSEDDGGLSVWYSDDEGKNWTKSKTEILSKKLGFVIAEGFVVETSKYTRLYFRTDMGTLSYFTSYNRGITWNLTPNPTPFASGACCFNIDVDPQNPDCLYAGWSYDNVNYFARHQFPRTRWSVAKSNDGGETWEMIGTVNEENSYYHENSNLSISVTSEHLFMNAYSQKGYMNGGASFGRLVSLPTKMQRTSKRFEQLHSQFLDQVENTRVMQKNLMDTTMAIQQKTGYVWVRGELYEGAFDGGFVDMNCATALIGARVEIGANGRNVISQAGRKHSVTQGAVKFVDGKPFVKLETFLEEFGLSVTKEGDVLIVGENDDWSLRQKKAFCYAVDILNSQP